MPAPVSGSDFAEEYQPEHEHFYEAAYYDPTCTEAGYTYYYCSCGDSCTEEGAPALGHSWDEGVVTLEPTTETEGVMT